MQHLHQVLRDGTTRHVDLSRETWNAGMKDVDVVRQWSHPADDCHSPLDRQCQGSQVAAVSTVVEEPWTEPIIWPPEAELTPKFLSEMNGLALDDAKEVLMSKRRQEPPLPRQRPVDAKGQWSLF